jgi:predicted RNA-binding protein associated with RNAse of E/G family
MTTITIEKRNHVGQRVFSYEGELLERSATHVCIVATFGRNDVNAGCVVFRKGDTMTEWFFSDRWYNIFRLQDVQTGLLKGWYCNITRPAEIEETVVGADDLALDVFVSTEGVVTVLDEDEFEQLLLSGADRNAALSAVDELRTLVAARADAFAEIGR